ncbi:MAG: hypothetical protein ACPGUD_14300 [Parashewanella sp.]
MITNINSINWLIAQPSQLSGGMVKTNGLNLPSSKSHNSVRYSLEIKHNATLDKRNNVRFMTFIRPSVSYGLFRDHGNMQIRKRVATFKYKATKEGSDILATRKAPLVAQSKRKRKRVISKQKEQEQD